MIFTIDPYYDIQHFNRTLESLKNNKVQYELFIDNRAPHYFYIEAPIQPVFMDYDLISTSRERNLVSLVNSYTPQNDYRFLRRTSHTGKQGFTYYSENDVFAQMNKTKQGVLIHMQVEHQFKVSKKYPRKLWFLGRYINSSFIVFQQDSLEIKNYLDVPHKILAQGSSFQHSTDLEAELNYKHFLFRERLIKLDETPVLQGGKYKAPQIRNQYGRKFILE